MRNKNTVRKTESTIKHFSQWLKSQPRYENRNILEIEAEKLDNYVGSFLLSIRKNDGTDYEPDTLTSYHRSIARYLKENKYPFDMVTDKQFQTSRTVLMSKRKELKQKGKGSKPQASEPITPNEEKLMAEKGCIGLTSPKQLQNKMWLQNTMLFVLRGGTENHKLRWGDIELKRNELGQEYLEYHERDTKTRTGEGNSIRAFKPKQFSIENDAENCPVNAYKTFRSHRPESMNNPDSPFYLAIKYNRKPNDTEWYKRQPLGENTLRAIMKNMAKQADLPGRKTNHSARKSTCTKLLHAGLHPTTIQQLTGHRNVQSINNYAVASNEMQKKMSNILCNQPVSSEQAAATPEMCNPSTMIEPNFKSSVSSFSSTLAGTSGEVFTGAKLMNCTISINHYHGSSDNHKRRRIRVIESDSDTE